MADRPTPPDPDTDPYVNVNSESWVASIGMALVYVAIVALVILCCVKA